MSGAPLSQYLAWLSYARDAYTPDAAIITVVGNDFDESHIKYALRDGFYHYTEDKDGTLRLRMTEYNPSLLRTLALKSALVRYLFFHLRVRETWATLRNQALQVLVADDGSDGPRYVGNTLATVDEDRRAVAVAVVRNNES
jgi:hypothetical protein